ncbi:MAG: AraC family transcriptional regulator ligand-binding domain-containing protein [Oceanococcaceae bacterium]
MSRVSHRVLQPLLLLARERGVAVPQLLADCGIPASAPVDSRIAEDTAAQLCALAVQRSGDPAFALRAGLSAAPHSLGPLGLVLQNSPTIRAAYAQLQRYWCFLHDEPLFQLDTQRDAVHLSFRRDSHRAPRERQALMEYLVSVLLRLSGSLAGGEQRGHAALKALSFRFPRPEPQRLSAYYDLLGCTSIRFSAERTGVSFDAALFRQPVPFADPELLQLFERRLRETLPGDGDDLPQRLRGLLRARLPGPLPALPDLARELGISRAQLQRRLTQAGTSYRRISEDLRRQCADDMLRDTDHSLAEIAFLLGFADSASFHHAYKRWTGHPPGAARARITGSALSP